MVLPVLRWFGTCSNSALPRGWSECLAIPGRNAPLMAPLLHTAYMHRSEHTNIAPLMLVVHPTSHCIDEWASMYMLLCFPLLKLNCNKQSVMFDTALALMYTLILGKPSLVPRYSLSSFKYCTHFTTASTHLHTNCLVVSTMYLPSQNPPSFTTCF